ncbi:SDR family NAD(P)-dependent oxidoreductase [Brachybacterium sacelli]|uniref:SDR family NAD(P)-dependent oxidoreductase n=1 Tax=Brachybacterium sacelli TaxID=173364 RepID=UPI0031DB3F33
MAGVRTVVVQGGTDGIGKGLASACLRRGDRVLVIGRSERKGEEFLDAARAFGASDRAEFLAADLSTVEASMRVVEEITSRFDRVDALVLCARHYSWRRQVTPDGFEATFALFYLSRFLFCHGLSESLGRAQAPVIVNVAGPGGSVEWMRWDDLGLSEGYDGQLALAQCGVANDLLGVEFARRHASTGIRYVLVNPGTVATSFSGDYDPATRAQIEAMKRMGAPVSQAIEPLMAILDDSPARALSAFAGGEPLPIDDTGSFDAEAARRLDRLTRQMLHDAHPQTAAHGSLTTMIDSAGSKKADH